MRVLIAGSRSIRDFVLLEQVVEEAGFPISDLLCGCAQGIDAMACHDRSGDRVPEEIEDGGLARDLGIVPYHYPVTPQDVRSYGARGVDGAYCRRDRHMVDHCDAAIFIWDGRSTGTGYTAQYAKQKGVPYVLFNQRTGQFGRSSIDGSEGR